MSPIRQVLLFFAPVIAGLIILLFAALAFGAHDGKSAFPFHDSRQTIESVGFRMVGEIRQSACSGQPLQGVQIINDDKTVGWLLWFGLKDIVAVRFSLTPDGAGIPNLTVYVTTEGTTFRVVYEQPFDPGIHNSPCDFFDRKDA